MGIDDTLPFPCPAPLRAICGCRQGKGLATPHTFFMIVRNSTGASSRYGIAKGCQKTSLTYRGILDYVSTIRLQLPYLHHR
jgi:hypothetical protein